MQKTLVPSFFGRPIPANHAAPRRRMVGATAMVSTLFTVVGQPYSPTAAGKGGFRRGMALLALEALQQRRLLAADIGAGAAMQIELEIIARAAGILADQPGRVGLVDRRLQMVRLVDELAADIDVAVVRAHADARQEAAFDQLVRVVADDVAVLAGAGLALVGIDDEIVRPVRLSSA